jgi:electron transfer flavoprotein beta subunit
MKILVAVKRVLDAYMKVKVSADETGVDLSNMKMAMNPFCEIAVEEAVRLKEKGIASEVIAVSIGDDKSQEQLRSAMALGADRAILVNSSGEIEPLTVARILHQLMQREQADLVLLGKQSIDSDNNQTGQMLSALSGRPQATFASRLEISDGKAVVTREVDGGEQTLALRLPAIVTTDLRLNEPRYATLPNIMKAKKKTIETITADDLGVEITASLKTLAVREPPGRKPGIMVTSAQELVEKLRHEARVLS